VLGLINTGTPSATVLPLMPQMTTLVVDLPPPIRMVLDSPATPGLPMSMLLLPVVRFIPALTPTAMLFEPVLLFRSASEPTAVLVLPAVLYKSAS